MYAVMARSVAARQHIGTVAVTAVGMFAGGGGFGITSLSLMWLEVIVGGMSQLPRPGPDCGNRPQRGGRRARRPRHRWNSGTSGERRGAIADQRCLTRSGVIHRPAGCHGADGLPPGSGATWCAGV
jgi:hypothetical protein